SNGNTRNQQSCPTRRSSDLRRTNQNERAKRAGEVREGNEKRIAGMEVMVAASKKMSQFMSQQNPEQRRRKRKTGQKSGRIFIKEREGDRKSTRLNSSHGSISYAV